MSACTETNVLKQRCLSSSGRGRCFCRASQSGSGMAKLLTPVPCSNTYAEKTWALMLQFSAELSNFFKLSQSFTSMEGGQRPWNDENLHQNQEEEVASLLTLLTVSSHSLSGVGRPHRGTSSNPSTPIHRGTTPCGSLGVCLWFDSQALWTQSSSREGSALRELLEELCLQSWRQGQPPPQLCSSFDSPCGFSCFINQGECNTKTSLHLDLSGNPSRNGTWKKLQTTIM